MKYIRKQPKKGLLSKELTISHPLSFLSFLLVVFSLPVTLLLMGNQTQYQQHAATSSPVIVVPTYHIYDGALAPGWHNGSADWRISFAVSSPSYDGKNVISFVAPKAYDGLYLYNDNTIDTSLYTSLSFAMRATRKNQPYSVALYDQNEQPLRAPILIKNYGGTPPAGSWKVYTIPLSDLRADNKQIKALLIQSQTNIPQPAVYIADIQLLPKPSVTATPTPGATTTTAPTQAQTASPTSSASNTNTWQSHVQAWIYPGNPACNASNEYHAQHIQTLKPQYYTLDNTGVLQLLTVQNAGCNAFSTQNATDVKAYSTYQYVTISGATDSMSALVGNSTKVTNAINTLVSFLQDTHFTGVDIDFEGFGQWTPTQYSQFKSFLTQLGNTLHQNGFKLMVDGPPVIADNSTLYNWHYSDFNSLPVDYITVMEYDWEYDFGAGTPVSPLNRMQDVTQQVMSSITDKSKVVIGVPSYGYHGAAGGYTISIDTYAQSSSYPGFSTAQRDSASAEMMWANNGISYDYADSTTLNTKRTNLENLGVQNISVWHLGGNQWFSGKSEPQ